MQAANRKTLFDLVQRTLYPDLYRHFCDEMPRTFDMDCIEVLFKGAAYTDAAPLRNALATPFSFLRNL